MKFKFAVFILAAAAASAAYFFYFRARGTADRLPANVLKLSGNIETHESLVGFKVSGRIVDLPIEEGQWVEPGTVLAKLDTADYRQQLAMDEAAEEVQRTQLDLGLAGTRPQQLKVAQQALNDAKADLAQKQLDYKRAETLYREGVGSQMTRDQADTNLKRAQTVAKSAQEQYAQALEGTRKEELAVDRAQLVQAVQKARLSRIYLDYTTLRAPNAGIVLVRNTELGEVVAPNTPVVTLGDLDHVWLRAYVNESDLGRIHWGQAVTVRTDSFPGKTYHGNISFISSKAEFTPKSVQTFQERVTLVYRIKIDLDNSHHELKPGMPADAEIQLASSAPGKAQ
jgi:membrane fusion protein YbhG